MYKTLIDIKTNNHYKLCPLTEEEFIIWVPNSKTEDYRRFKLLNDYYDLYEFGEDFVKSCKIEVRDCKAILMWVGNNLEPQGAEK